MFLKTTFIQKSENQNIHIYVSIKREDSDFMDTIHKWVKSQKLTFQNESRNVRQFLSCCLVWFWKKHFPRSA